MTAIDYDPLALGYVKSLARPGGNVTGISIPAARQKRSKLADTSSHALPTAPKVVGGKAVAVVLNLFMALLSFRGISTPSLQAQGEQRRLPISTLAGTIPTALSGHVCRDRAGYAAKSVTSAEL